MTFNYIRLKLLLAISSALLLCSTVPRTVSGRSAFEVFRHPTKSSAPLARPTMKPDRVISTEHFTFAFSIDSHHLVLQLDTLAQEAERIFDHVSERLPVSGGRRIDVVFKQRSTSPCPYRGLAIAKNRTVRIFVHPNISLDEVFAIIAHEIGHVLTHQTWSGYPGDRGLTEGTASWAAGRYWSAWRGVSSFEEAVLALRRDGTYLPLHDINTAAVMYEAKRSGRCVEFRDVLYTEWASFIGYLIQHYGWDKLNQVVAYSSRTYLQSGGRKLARFYFEEVYDRSFEEAEAEWLAWISEQYPSSEQGVLRKRQ